MTDKHRWLLLGAVVVVGLVVGSSGPRAGETKEGITRSDVISNEDVVYRSVAGKAASKEGITIATFDEEVMTQVEDDSEGVRLDRTRVRLGTSI